MFVENSTKPPSQDNTILTYAYCALLCVSILVSIRPHCVNTALLFYFFLNFLCTRVLIFTIIYYVLKYTPNYLSLTINMHDY